MDEFLEKVRLNPCLWDKAHNSSKDTVKKDVIWDRVAFECGLDNGALARRHFRKLRDCHRDARRRRKYARGPVMLKPWKYEAEMAFLLSPYESQNTPNTSMYTEEVENKYDHIFTTTDNIDTEPSSPLLEQHKTTDAENMKRKRLDETVTEVSQERREQRQFQRDEYRRSQDALATLFESLYQKTRELPKYLQLRVQREIFESVTRAEEEVLELS
uniref:MADF domain-containing protein n=1 Tax=Pectinophora gossypiella TaxID=13191 RepID=A0A1E1WMI9_PECGO